MGKFGRGNLVVYKPAEIQISYKPAAINGIVI